MFPVEFSRLSLSIKVICSQNVCNFHGKINTVAKRASMLKDMIVNRDKRKNWHFEMMPTKSKVRVFEKIHKPFRRKAVLNSLFISNITDVISTGDVAPDLMKYGIEITGVSVSPCMKILNVFWQVPQSHYDSCDDIGKLLAIASPKIRAELISRNVLGRVPRIFFLRDATNERISEFEAAMRKLEAEPKIDTGVVVDDSFTEELYVFKDSKKKEDAKESKEKIPKLSEETQVTKDVPPTQVTKDVPPTPYKPVDMKLDVCGLNHRLLMDKVIALKKKMKNPLLHTNVVFPETLQSVDDLFSKIPGVCFQAGSTNETESRNAILKKFQIERKMLKEKPKVSSKQYDDLAEEIEEEDFNSQQEIGDFIDDEIADNTHSNL